MMTMRTGHDLSSIGQQHSGFRGRTTVQEIKDFVTFPIRAVTLFDVDKWGLTALSSERFYYVSREVLGYCLDVGCGKNNRFIQRFLNGNGKGIDVFRYEGLTEEHLVEDITQFPFADCTFDTVTFIANLNHVSKSKRDIELSEAHRCLRPGGNLIVTMGNPIAELLVHGVVYLYDKLFGTNFDMDTERGMEEGEEYYLTTSEIQRRIERAGFVDIRKKYFVTQWGLNHLFVACKP
jgi:SAM-dependent methyltransferase